MRILATPMGGLTTNVSDLARLGQMLLNQGQSGGEEFLTAKIVDSAMTLKERNHPDLDQGFGLGLKVRTWRGRRSVGHDGNMPGVAAQLILCPEDGVGAVVLTNGYSLAVPHQVAALVVEHLLELPADTQLTSAPSMTRAETKDWESLGRRVEGSYQLRDSTPPGLGELLNRFLLRISVTHEAAGRLRIEGSPGSDGPAWLIPTATLGQYRIAAGVDNGTNAVVDEQPDGVHLWFGYVTHLHKR
jgi:CubicO group peptidase (beta-lactamase class C family)